MFLPCVLVTSAHEPRGGARFLFFWGQIRGGERLLPQCSVKHGGQMGVKYVGPLFFAEGRFLGYFRWRQQQSRQGKKRGRRRTKRKEKKTKGEKNDKKKNKEEEEEEEQQEE